VAYSEADDGGFAVDRKLGRHEGRVRRRTRPARQVVEHHPFGHGDQSSVRRHERLEALRDLLHSLGARLDSGPVFEDRVTSLPDHEVLDLADLIRPPQAEEDGRANRRASTGTEDHPTAPSGPEH
jgi:hypothetical protein